MPNPRVRLDVDTREVGKRDALGNVKDRLREITAAIPGVTGALGSIASVSAGIAGALAGAAAAVKAFATTAQEPVAKLDAALANVSRLTEENRQKMQELAGEMQKTTGVADDQWIGVLTRLVQFGANPDSIGMDLEAVKNLAGLVGDLGTATTLYTRALQGNFSMLSRYGIQAKSIAELQEESKKGLGQLEARAEALTGKYQNLRNVIGDTAEAIGGQIVKSTRLGEIIDFLAGGFEWWAEKIGGTVEQLDAIHNRTLAASGSAADYSQHLTRIAELTEKVGKASDAAAKSIKAQQAAQDEVANAKLALDIANVDEAERSGRISPRQAIASRYKLRRNAAASTFTRAQAADQAVLQANESAYAQLLTMRRNLGLRRDQLGAEIGAGSIAESRATRAADVIGTLEAERRFVESQGGGVALKAQRLAEIDRGIAIAQRIGPASLDRQRAEVSALDQSIGGLDKEIAGRRSSLLTSNTEIAQRMATRATVFGLNDQRDAVMAGGDAERASAVAARNTNSAAAAMQQSLESVASTTGMMVRVSQQMLQAMAETQRRLSAIEAQVKNGRNQ